MTQKDVLKHETLGEEKKSVGYYVVKYTVFLTPPLLIFLVAYYLLNDFLLSIAAMVVTMFIAIVIIALWYMKKTSIGV